MKKKIIFGIMLLSCIKVVNAASVSVSASSNYVTSGSGVTFYVNISGAASWQLTGYSAGATSGCDLGDQGTGDSGDGSNVNKTLSVYCKATSVGQISFTVTGNITSSSNGDVGSSKDVSATKTVTVQAPRQLDSNNNLGSLEVEGYKLSPAFSADTLEYSVEVPSTVNSVNIIASKASSYATLSGNGKKEVNEGANLFEVVVTSETGVAKVYKVTVNVKDNNPINIKIGNVDYTVIKNTKNIVKPELYEETKITINDIEVPAFYNENTHITLIGVKDKEGNVRLAIYNAEKNTYEIYEELKSNQLILLIRNIPEVKEGYFKTNITIDDQDYECLKISDNSDYAILYATDLLTGEEDYYIYDVKTNSYVRYTDENLVPLKNELAKYKEVILYLGIGLGVVVFFLFLSLITRPKKMKKNKEKINNIDKPIKSKKEKKQKKTIETESEVKNDDIVSLEKEETKDDDKKQSQKDALQSVEEAAMIIEQFEKKALRKTKKEKEDVKEETMYDIFEDDKKKKRR